MKDRKPANDYSAIEDQIRRAHLERSVELGRIFADAAHAIGRAAASVLRFVRVVLGSMGDARHARMIEADALVGRNLHR